ncbi:MAG: peptidoglycan editing factor PgeF [Desulfobacterales bacterium]|nr:peptidoglycan editing factor PgeF [Desulfobacterales bacterium]
MARLKPLCFEHLAAFPGVVHGVFSRTGGNSSGDWSGLNIGLSTGDDPVIVQENRSDMMASLGLTRALFLNQVHGADILVIKPDTDLDGLLWEKGKGSAARPLTADGVVTNVGKIGLVIQVADCQAVLLYDPVNQVIANVHSGWRGSLENITGRCVDTMIKEFDCRPIDIRVGISPSLGPCCAEFIHYETEIPKRFWHYKRKERPYFDFWQISKDQLEAKGVIQDHISVMGQCTKCCSDQFYSYRAQKTTGRFGAVIALNSVKESNKSHE